MTDVLSSSDVAGILGVKTETLRFYRAHSKPAGRYENHPFPKPDYDLDGRPAWKADREQEIRDWAAKRPGKGVGGGRPKQLHHRDGDPRNNDPGNLEVRERPDV
jgi:hypothetical protein